MGLDLGLRQIAVASVKNKKGNDINYRLSENSLF